MEFGQIPKQVFHLPHPKRILSSSSSSIPYPLGKETSASIGDTSSNGKDSSFKVIIHRGIKILFFLIFRYEKQGKFQARTIDGIPISQGLCKLR